MIAFDRASVHEEKKLQSRVSRGDVCSLHRMLSRGFCSVGVITLRVTFLPGKPLESPAPVHLGAQCQPLRSALSANSDPIRPCFLQSQELALSSCTCCSGTCSWEQGERTFTPWGCCIESSRLRMGWLGASWRCCCSSPGPCSQSAGSPGPPSPVPGAEPCLPAPARLAELGPPFLPPAPRGLSRAFQTPWEQPGDRFLAATLPPTLRSGLCRPQGSSLNTTQ